MGNFREIIEIYCIVFSLFRFFSDKLWGFIIIWLLKKEDLSFSVMNAHCKGLS